ncbi:MAG: hypothetical protein JW747_01780 [Candidatus Aminicenantes bacterium]|nr:hypothetical protein [Candidatus Aminicenantes bacterium]
MVMFFMGRRIVWALLAAALVLGPAPASAGGETGPAGLMPELSGWTASEDIRTYSPETLFEHIDGAAESYLGYDFQALAVGQFRREDGSGELTIEIYDMGRPRNAFGIYSAERYPESRFVPVGVQGYLEDGLLNFLAARFYVKLMCYDCGPEAESVLTSASRAVADKAGDGPGFPSVLSAFPRRGLVANSERFILRNFLGHSFLEAGYTALYRRGEEEFECFIIDGRSGEEAETMLRRLSEPAAAGSPPDEDAAFHWKDRYLGNVYVLRAGRFLCGMLRVPDGMTGAVGEFLDEIVRRLAESER